MGHGETGLTEERLSVTADIAREALPKILEPWKQMLGNGGH